MALPAGPTSVVWTTLRYLRDPYGSFLAASQEYGDPYTSPSFLGTMVVTGDPVGIRTIFSADPETYEALGAELLAPVLGESNLILLSGERHHRMRKLLLPPFHGQRTKAYGETIQRVARAHAGRWPRGESFGVHATMQAISLEVILEAVLGLTDPDAQRTIGGAVLATIAALSPSFMFLPALRIELGGLAPWGRFVRLKRRLLAIFEREIEQRRASGSPRQDILSLLLDARYDDGAALSSDELLTQMINLVVAGHETTASSLAWAFHFIHRDPTVERKLRDELAALPGDDLLDPEAVARLPYLDAVCSETLRIHPVAPIIGRTLRRPMVLLGHELPAGVSVGAAILLAHRRPDLYPEPDRFRPERFLERSFSPFEFLPFGGGARRCLGAAFAEQEMKLVLAAILRQHTLRAASDRPVRVSVRNTTVGPGDEILLRHA